MKTCQQCRKSKPNADFHLDRRTQRRAPVCRACYRASDRGIVSLWDVPDTPLAPGDVDAVIARCIAEMLQAKAGKR